MKIIFDCERMKYGFTGLFEYCLQLGRKLQSCKEVEDSIGFYLPQELSNHFVPADDLLYQRSLHKFIFPRYRKIDLWHTTYQLSSYIPKSKTIKRLLTVHDLNFLHEGKSQSKIRKYLKLHQQNIDLADHIVTISEFTKNDLLRRLDVGGKPITVIYNGCDDKVWSSASQPLSAPNKPFLFALGTVNPKKNFHVLVPLVVNNEYELIIAGKIDSDYNDQIMHQASIHNVADKVRVIGPVTEQDKAWYYKNCDAFLFPSLAEGFGIPPIEAMRYGKPVFLSDKTSLPEIGGEVAYYFDDFDPEAIQLSFDKGMAHYSSNQPAAKIINHSNKFNWENSAKSYLKAYKETIYG